MRHLYIPLLRLGRRTAEIRLREATGGSAWLDGHIWPVEAATIADASHELRRRGVPLASTLPSGCAIIEVAL